MTLLPPAQVSGHRAMTKTLHFMVLQLSQTLQKQLAHVNMLCIPQKLTSWDTQGLIVYKGSVDGLLSQQYVLCVLHVPTFPLLHTMHRNQCSTTRHTDRRLNAGSSSLAKYTNSCTSRLLLMLPAPAAPAHRC